MPLSWKETAEFFWKIMMPPIKNSQTCPIPKFKRRCRIQEPCIAWIFKELLDSLISNYMLSIYWEMHSLWKGLGSVCGCHLLFLAVEKQSCSFVKHFNGAGCQFCQASYGKCMNILQEWQKLCIQHQNVQLPLFKTSQSHNMLSLPFQTSEPTQK